MPTRSRPTALLRVDDVLAEVTYKPIRNLRLRVLPPDGRVAVSVPHGVPETTVLEFIQRNRGWITRARTRVAEAGPAAGPLHDGAPVRLWGTTHVARVTVTAKASAAVGADATLLLRGPDPDARRRALDNLYKDQIRAQLTKLRPEWEGRVGRNASVVKLRRMTTRWGTCNTRSAAVTLNVALAEHPPSALEYVLVHELVHLHERGHGPRFTGWMDRLLPDWRDRRRALRGG